MSSTASSKQSGTMTYRDQLRILINKPEYGLLLNADKWWKEGHPETEAPQAAFKLGSSERFQKEFITLWELFDHSDEADLCLKHLADEVRSIRTKYSFSTIVSATATSRHILERLHSRIETPEDKIRLEFMHRYPFLSSDRQSVLNFQGQKVLIFSDVVASGSLVSDLAAVVHHLGGQVVAVLCVVLTGKVLIEQLSPNPHHHGEKPPIITLKRYGAPIDRDRIPLLSADGTTVVETSDEVEIRVPVFSLTDRFIPGLIPRDYQEKQVIPIDLESVYPEEMPLGINGVTPRFTAAEMYDHLQSAEAIQFDFFEIDGSHFTTGVRLSRLLDRVGDQIWNEIEPEFEPMIDQWVDRLQKQNSESSKQKTTDPSEQLSHFALVSTFRAGDSEYRSFIEKRLKSSIRSKAGVDDTVDLSGVRSIYINIRELPEGTDYMLIPRGSDQVLQGCHVFLLLASVGASQTLQDLVALMAGNGVRSITVVVLINRMGLRTQNFVARIRKLVRGLSPHGPDDATFEFIPLYCINELGSRDIRALEDAVGTLFRTYRERTKVPGFRNWIEQTRRYFEPHIVTGLEFRDDVLRKLSQPLDFPIHENRGIEGTSQVAKLTTLEALLSCLCHRMVADRDFDGLINLIGELENKRDLYQVYALLLHGVGFLRRRNRFGNLRATILERIHSLRKARFDAEISKTKSEQDLSVQVERIVELEAHLVFGLALFSYMDLQDGNYDKILVDCLTASRNVEQWLETPMNFLTHFSDERLAWSVSMLLLLSRQKFEEDPGWMRLCEILVNSIRSCKEAIRHRKEELEQKLPEVADDETHRSLETLTRLCRDNLDALLTDLGQHRLVRYDQIIRFLHSHLLQKPHHSPIISTLRALELALDGELKSNPHRDSAIGRAKIREPGTKRVLEEASSTIGLLEQIAQAAIDMFGFTPAERDQVSRFADAHDQDSFLQDVQHLGRSIRAIRNENTISAAAFTAIGARIQRIDQDLFTVSSPLRQSLERYRVSLVDAVVEAMAYARNRFSSTLRDKPEGKRLSKRYHQIFDSQFEKWKRLKETTESEHPFVLVDPFLLRETLRNIFTNVRHTVGGLRLKPEEYPQLLKVTWEPFERSIDNDPTEMIRVTVYCRGKKPRQQEQLGLGTGTLREQALTLQKYAASMQLAPVTDPKPGYCTVLEMIKRRPPAFVVKNTSKKE